MAACRPARRTPGLGGRHGARGRWTRAASSRVPARPGPGELGSGACGPGRPEGRRVNRGRRAPPGLRGCGGGGTHPASRPPGPRRCRRSRAVLAEVAGGLKPEPRSPRVLPRLGWGRPGYPDSLRLPRAESWTLSRRVSHYRNSSSFARRVESPGGRRFRVKRSSRAKASKHR